MIKRPSIFTCIVNLFIATTFIPFASAQTIIDWNAGGASDYYGNVFNWDGLNIPNNNTESARFDFGGSYNVTIQSGLTTTVSDMIVQQGDINLASNGAVFASYNTEDDLRLIGGDLTLDDAGGAGDVLFIVDDDTDVGGGGELYIRNGSDLDTLDLFVGRNSSSNGTAMIDGVGSTLDVAGSVTLGSSGSTGTLIYQNDSTGSTITGTTTLGSGSIAGTTGRLTVRFGAELNTGNLRVGSLSTSASAIQEAKVTVDGTDSALTMSGTSTLTVGDATNPNIASEVYLDNRGTFNTGTGAVQFQNSGTLTIVDDSVFNANADVTFDGGSMTRSIAGQFNLAAGVNLIANNDADISISGAYQLNNGSQITVDTGSDLFISSPVVGFGSAGTITADGTGTTFSTLTSSLIALGVDSGSADLTYSNNATGTLGDVRVSNFNDADANTAGTLTVESDAAITIDNLDINIAGGLGASGSVTVTGTDSTLTQTGASSLTLGHASTGTATLDLEDGGEFISGTGTTTVNTTGTLNIGMDASFAKFTANGPVVVDGGTLNKSSSLLEVAPFGSVTIQNGGAMHTTGGEYTDEGVTYTVTGSGSEVTNNNILFIVDNAKYNVLDGASLTVATGIRMFSGAWLTVDGSGSSLDNNGALEVGNSTGTFNVTVSDNATATSTGLTIANDPAPANISAAVSIHSGGQFDAGTGDVLLQTNGGASKDATISIQGVGSLFTQHPSAGGDIIVGNNSAGFPAAIYISHGDSGATLTTTSNPSSEFIIRQTGIVRVGGFTTTGTLNVNMPLTIDGGKLNVSLGDLNMTGFTFINQNGGRIQGSGTIDMNLATVQNHATVSPGIADFPINTAGTLTIANGHFTQHATGILEIELGGTTAGTEHDALDVARNLTVDGTLNVSLINSFAPQAGDSFDILDWGFSLFGSFDNINLPPLDPGLNWDTSNLLIDGTLLVSPDAITGDLDGDGFVGIDDLNLVLGNWNQNVPPANPLADPSGDGFVGIDDLNEVLGNWNAGIPPGNSANIPEPTTLATLGLGVPVLLRRHRRLMHVYS